MPKNNQGPSAAGPPAYRAVTKGRQCARARASSWLAFVPGCVGSISTAVGDAGARSARSPSTTQNTS
eukprot:3953117-Pyramimonas_sp.AAC.1